MNMSAIVSTLLPHHRRPHSQAVFLSYTIDIRSASFHIIKPTRTSSSSSRWQRSHMAQNEIDRNGTRLFTREKDGSQMTIG